MSNKVRGEVDIFIGDKLCKLRPTFDALLEIESKLGEGLPSVFVKAADGKLGLKEVAAIIYGGRIGAGENVSFSQVGEEVLEHGFQSLMVPAIQFLQGALFKKSSSGEEKKTQE